MEAIAIDNLPKIKKGDDLVKIISGAIDSKGILLEDGDIIVVAEKIVSKAEGGVVNLDALTPSKEAERLSEKIGKDPRVVELILGESKEILWDENFIITETKHGFICANAGIDTSNVEEGHAKLLPKSPDASAKKLRDGIMKNYKKQIGVLIADSWGRPFRKGSVGVAIGSSGLRTLWDRRGEKDIFGKRLKVTRVALGDSLASTASLIMGEAGEMVPVVVIKGANFAGNGTAKDLIREKEEDVFRRLDLIKLTK
ncbi:MAG: coenzyme F420-0:L-glutamate ligase [Candidatus Hydrothermarchaeaceae archaeon]